LGKTPKESYWIEGLGDTIEMKDQPKVQRAICPCCHASESDRFFRVEGVPVHSVLLFPKRQEALSYSKGDITLAFCRACGFIWNIDFDPKVHEYSPRYEETQGASPTFRTFQKRLAESLIARHDLYGKDILEIGCGKGEFLALLCQLGENCGVGIDPAYSEDRLPVDATEQIQFVKELYAEKHGAYPADFLCCKMTLEHIQETARFVSLIRSALEDKPDTVVFFQVPDVVRILRDVAFWDIYYEHCSYFSLGSLARLFRRCHFDVLRLWKDFDDQYLMIEARPGGGPSQASLSEEDDLSQLGREVSLFANKYAKRLAEWRQSLRQIWQRGGRTVLWGGGSKAVSFLTTLGICEEIEFAVDINPFKQGTYLAGTGQKIVGPEHLEAYKPDVVIVMNPIYLGEIRKTLKEMNLTPQLIPVQADSRELFR